MPLSRFVAYFCSLVAVCLVAFPRTLPAPAPAEQFAQEVPDDSPVNADGSNTCNSSSVAPRPPQPVRPHYRHSHVLLLSGDFVVTRARSRHWPFSHSDGGKMAKPERGLTV